MIDPLRTLTELAEPLGRLSPRKLPLNSLLGRGRTSLSEPRPALPRGHVEYVPGAGDLFYRDTARRGGGRPRHDPVAARLDGALGPALVSDLELAATGRLAGDRARRPRPRARDAARNPFRLTDCADDAAALVRHLGCAPVYVVGYSMGGIVAQLVVRDHPDVVRGVVLCATGCEFQTSLLMRGVWAGMGLWQFYLRFAPQWVWEQFVQAIAQGDRETTAWAVGELRRGAAWDIAEAGREIGRFDSREWVGELDAPAAVVITTVDFLVPPARQRELARRMRVEPLELRSDHLAPATTPRRFHACLGEALDRVEAESLDAVASSTPA